MTAFLGWIVLCLNFLKECTTFIPLFKSIKYRLYTKSNVYVHSYGVRFITRGYVLQVFSCLYRGDYLVDMK